MELKAYLRLIAKYWWIVLPVFVITLVATAVFTFARPPTYRSVATFVVAPGTAFEDARSSLDGLDTLSRRTEIAATYAEIAASRTVTRAAFDDLGLSPDEREDISVTGDLLGGTNILRISVESTDPVIARDVANAIGAQTVEYAQDLYEFFALKPLDPATVRLSTVGPTRFITLVLGGAFGLILGAGLAFLADYLRTPERTD